MIEPLPCPFCGHVGLVFSDGGTYRWGVASCSGCGATTGETRREYPDTGAWHADAIADWNCRWQEPREERLRAAMERADREGPMPGMIRAFEVHYGVAWTDSEWRQETSTWAAAWSAASASQPAQPPQVPAENAEFGDPRRAMTEAELQEFCIACSFEQDDYTETVIRSVEDRMLAKPLFFPVQACKVKGYSNAK